MSANRHSFGSKFAQTYTAQCDECERFIEVSTQTDESPEYLTDVFVRCHCGGAAQFCLPVN